MCLLSFLQFFHCFGTSGNAREQLKINDDGNIFDWITCLIKHGGMFSGVLMIFLGGWLNW